MRFKINIKRENIDRNIWLRYRAQTSGGGGTKLTTLQDLMDLSFVENVERGNFKNPNPAYCLHYMSASPGVLIFDGSTYEIKSDLVKCKSGYKLYLNRNVNYQDGGGKHCIQQQFFEYEKTTGGDPGTEQYIYVLEIGGNRAGDALGTNYYGSYRYVNTSPSTLETRNSSSISFYIRSYKYKMSDQYNIIPVPWNCKFLIDTLKDDGLSEGGWSDQRLTFPIPSERQGTGKNAYGEIDLNYCTISWNSNNAQIGPSLLKMPGATLPYLPTVLLIHQEQGHVDPYDQYSDKDGQALQGCVQVHVQYGN